MYNRQRLDCITKSSGVYYYEYSKKNLLYFIIVVGDYFKSRNTQIIALQKLHYPGRMKCYVL